MQRYSGHYNHVTDNVLVDDCTYCDQLKGWKDVEETREAQLPLFVKEEPKPPAPLVEIPVVTLVQRREDYGVFNDRQAPAFRHMTDDEWLDSMLGTPLFVGTLWEARQYARHFTEARDVAGTLDKNGKLLVMLQVVTMSEWEVVPDDAQ